MTANLSALDLKKLKGYAYWPLLLFLVLFFNVKLAIKIPALILAFIFQPTFKFGFSLKGSRLPLFYPAIITITILAWLANAKQLQGYTPVAITGLLFWIICLFATHQVKRFTEVCNPDVVHRTLVIFFALNALVSFYNIAAIIWEIKSVNPYVYQGQYQKYFISTGDFIRGISFDTSTTNALVSAFGVIYFLYRQHLFMMCVCMASLLLTGSNYISICLCAILTVLFVVKTNRVQKSAIISCLCMLVLFMAKISPQNNHYVINLSRFFLLHKKQPGYVPPPQNVPVTQIPDNQLNAEQRRQKTAQLFIDSVSLAKLQVAPQKTSTAVLPVAPQPPAAPAPKILDLPKPNIHTPPYQTRTFTDAEQNLLLKFIEAHKPVLALSGKDKFKSFLPGKVISQKQTFSYLKTHPALLATGTGAGNFSSKLAYRATGLGFAGSFPVRFTYINPIFLSNHLDVYLNFFSRRPGYHSLTNSPNSTFDQMLAEYGLPGLFAFLALYLGFFGRQYKRLTYGLPMLALMTAAFFIDYWFEQLSILALFELMLYLDIKETEKKAALTPPEPALALEYAH